MAQNNKELVLKVSYKNNKESYGTEEKRECKNFAPRKKAKE